MAPADAPKTTMVRPHRERPSEVLSVKVPSMGCLVSLAAPRCCSMAPMTLVSHPTVAKVSRVEMITWPLYPAVSEPPMVWRCGPLGHHRDVPHFTAQGSRIGGSTGRSRPGDSPQNSQIEPITLKLLRTVCGLG